MNSARLEIIQQRRNALIQGGQQAVLERREDVAVVVPRLYHRSLESIAKTKADLLDALQPHGTAVLPRDSKLFEYLLDRSRSTGNGIDVITFGRHESADMRLVSHPLHANTSTVTAQFRNLTLTYELGLRGQHQVMNSLSVLAAVAAAGGNLRLAAASLSAFVASFRRGERFRIPIQDGVVKRDQSQRQDGRRARVSPMNRA